MNDRQINEMLSYLDCEDRITCLKVASALKNEFGDAGYPTFHSFCMNANNYEQPWVESNWKSADPAKATIALLAYLARLNGGVVQVLPCSERAALKVPSPDDRGKIDYAKNGATNVSRMQMQTLEPSSRCFERDPDVKIGHALALGVQVVKLNNHHVTAVAAPAVKVPGRRRAVLLR